MKTERWIENVIGGKMQKVRRPKIDAVEFFTRRYCGAHNGHVRSDIVIKIWIANMQYHIYSPSDCTIKLIKELALQDNAPEYGGCLDVPGNYYGTPCKLTGEIVNDLPNFIACAPLRA
jgi:hypothetical protein